MTMSQRAVDAFATMDRHLAEAAVELFASYGMVVRRLPTIAEVAPGTTDESVMAVIGYAGDKVRGALVLTTRRPAIETWLAALGEAVENADVCDALGEFSNMLLGRLKGRLLPEGFPILLSTPTTALGGGLRLSNPVRPSVWLAFEGPPSWRLDVRLDATFEEGFALQPSDGRQGGAEAGDMLLF
jgi:CheY-specific phosphatase CheX